MLDEGESAADVIHSEGIIVIEVAFLALLLQHCQVIKDAA